MNDMNNEDEIEKTLSYQMTTMIDQALQHQRQQEPPRDYLGGSQLGKPCGRALQYEYIGVPVDANSQLTGRAIRIFQAGHVFEDLIIDWLTLAGFDIQTRNDEGEQYGWSAVNGRLQGHVDGVIVNGPKDIHAKYPALFEAKSLNDASWQTTSSNGLVKSKPIYAAQIALYQAYMDDQFPGICQHPALFAAINKNTAELYFEWIAFDVELAQRISDKAVKIIRSVDGGDLLPRITNKPDHYACRFCGWKERCWSA